LLNVRREFINFRRQGPRRACVQRNAQQRGQDKEKTPTNLLPSQGPSPSAQSAASRTSRSAWLNPSIRSLPARELASFVARKPVASCLKSEWSASSSNRNLL